MSIKLLLPIFLLIGGVVVPHFTCAEGEGLDTLTIKQGTLQGIPLTGRSGRTYYGFLGIPFGKVPERFAVRLTAVLLDDLMVILVGSLLFRSQNLQTPGTVLRKRKSFHHSVSSI